jgi:hypothetical protein
MADGSTGRQQLGETFGGLSGEPPSKFGPVLATRSFSMN